LDYDDDDDHYYYYHYSSEKVEKHWLRDRDELRLVCPFPDVYFNPGNTGMAVLIPGIPGRPGMTYIMRD